MSCGRLWRMPDVRKSRCHAAHSELHAIFVQPLRFTAHRHAMLALSSLHTAVVDIPHFLWVPTRQHLVDEAIIVALIIARIEAFKPIPVLAQDLFEDIPVQRGLCSHQAVPSWGMEMCAVTLLYHVSPAQSTPSSACPEARSPTSLP